MEHRKKIVAVLIVNYNGRGYLEDCLRSLAAVSSVDIEQITYVVDNASDDDSVHYMTKEWPEVCLVRSNQNLGYAGGNTLGWQRICRDIPDIKYIFLLNQDTIVTPNFLAPLVDYFENHEDAAALQPKLMLHPETHKINSLGNVTHFLGFGYSSFNGVNENEAPVLQKRINYASGAAVLLRRSVIDDIGLFDEFMFMYLEDLDLGWRIMLAGKESALVPESVVYHKYEFSRGMRHYYYFERNRLWILLKNYRIATLIALIPASLLMESAQLGRAFVTGMLRSKLRTYSYFFSLSNVRKLIHDRRRTQTLRKTTDRRILQAFSGSIVFQPIDSVLLRYVANPFFTAYLFILKKVVFW